ncbi:MAG: DUF507 family protein [Nitrospirae bacterium]|nr:DUF507 family protein [Nitrospirota bacterium]
MRIPKSWVPFLAKRIVDTLIKKELIEPTIPGDELVEEAGKLLMNELMVEDRLHEEVRLILKKYESEIAKGRLDYKRLFDMTKQKLVKEKNLVL